MNRSAPFVLTLSIVIAAALLTSAGPSFAVERAPGERAAVLRVLTNYRAAMAARDLGALAKTVAPDLMVAEGTLVNLGWEEYRDRHIGPEMRGWLYFRVSGVRTEALEISGDQAFAVQGSIVTLGENDGPVSLASVETFVLRRTDGSWKIRHIHFSGKRIPVEAP